MWELSVYGWQVTPETQMNSSKKSAQLEISTVAFQGRVSAKEPGKGTERTVRKVSDKSGKFGVATDKCTCPEREYTQCKGYHVVQE